VCGDACDDPCSSNIDHTPGVSEVKVNIFDLSVMKNDYKRTDCASDNETHCCKADIDTTGSLTGEVDIFDLLLMKNEYNSTYCSGATPPCVFP
jgi:hypothetical protein